MKKIIILLLSITLLNSCAEKVSSENEAKRAPGYLKKDGKIYDVDDANPENLDLWDNYIEAHNKRDIEAINQMNADSTKQFGFLKFTVLMEALFQIKMLIKHYWIHGLNKKIQNGIQFSHTQWK